MTDISVAGTSAPDVVEPARNLLAGLRAHDARAVVHGSPALRDEIVTRRAMMDAGWVDLAPAYDATVQAWALIALRAIRSGNEGAAVPSAILAASTASKAERRSTWSRLTAGLATDQPDESPTC